VNVGLLHQREMVALRWAPESEKVLFLKEEFDAAMEQATRELKHEIHNKSRGAPYYWNHGYPGYEMLLYRAKEILFLRRQI
jgi:hypothetical protein